MHDRLHRLGWPVCLSIFLHGLLALVVCVPSLLRPNRPESTAQPRRIPRLTLSLEAPRPRPARPPPLPAEEELPIDVEPQLLRPAAAVLPTPGAESPGLPSGLGSSAAGAAPGNGSGRGGSGLVPAGGVPLLGVGRRVESVVYLLDRSISMGPAGGLERARHELRTALATLPSTVSVQVLAYNRTVLPLIPSLTGLRLRGRLDLTELSARLDELTPSGGTDHVAALRRGLALRPDVLFLITDAADLSDAQVRQVAALNPGGVHLHVIELAGGSARPDAPAVRLAAISGGQHRRVPPR